MRGNSRIIEGTYDVKFESEIIYELLCDGIKCYCRDVWNLISMNCYIYKWIRIDEIGMSMNI